VCHLPDRIDRIGGEQGGMGPARPFSYPEMGGSRPPPSRRSQDILASSPATGYPKRV
jgi:hypothetical protein